MAYPFWTLDLNFAASRMVDPRVLFSRASVATHYNTAGTLLSDASGQPRIGHSRATGETRGLIIEDTRTNYLWSSAAPATQTRTLAAGTYVLWLDGTGSVTLSGGPAGVATAASPVSFTLAGSTNVTFTVAGAVTRFQCELGAMRTSFISTASASFTRAADVATVATSDFAFNSAEGTLLVEFSYEAAGNNYACVASLSDGSFSNQIYITTSSAASPRLSVGTRSGAADIGSGSVIGPTVLTDGTPMRVAIAYSYVSTNIAFRGTAGTAYSGAVPVNPNTLVIGEGAGTRVCGNISRIAYCPRWLAPAVLQTLTA
jgi:hypothetical protein